MNATFPKLRSTIVRRPVSTKRAINIPPRKRLPERRRTEKTREKKREVKLPEKQKRVEKREVKEENVSKKKTSGAEASPKKSENDRTTDGLIEQILGKYKRDGDSPRSRSLKELLEYCDVSLLSNDVLQKAGTLITKSEQSTKDDFKARTCIRTYNPTVLGPLDDYVPLGLFEDEVKMDDSFSDAASDKVLRC
ncbi:hypothetical protein TELCIR_09981 [Teladorsagia circumcincta]|uniref:Uncharacterized protein n=1 Tax=Teladorsagia circumcincta TaxID=45464 RepID=A0A2G9UDC3_TELCI|nr:hypothetical protein TELCIR_09981 [Teladorsagia circumcincta]